MNVAYIDVSKICGVGRLVFLKKEQQKHRPISFYFILLSVFIVNVKHLLCVSLNPIQLNVIIDMPHLPQGLLIDN